MTTTPTTRTFDPLDLREAFSHFPQGVVAVGAQIDGAPQALVASTFTVGVSLEPPLVTFAVQHTSQTWPRLRSAPALGVSVMGRDQFGLCRQLASKDRASRFDGVDYAIDDAGALTLPASPMWLSTRIYDEVRAGDHDIVILEITDVGSIPGAAGMVFHQSSFKELAALELSA
ncbi:flavin reductase family protein [Nesterenkonia aerolata]|uniref:Flavin reductase family protein n=1 Tax=Nesterenkonia aerolata TaxID=3074079 RepID=A0ABU2DR57_9MICC|nr:flavin reductase family protein [Nesterenkonia sp. LY-0111]MDR8018997.1 flavin reductase family protein [Nesterenkonia sp. LY-0111]